MGFATKFGLAGAASVAVAMVALAHPAGDPPILGVIAAQPPKDRIPFPPGSGAELELPDASLHTVKSVLNVPDRMEYGDFVWNEEGVADGELLVRIDLRAQTVAVFRGGHEIGTAVILYGADGKQTPRGIYPIIEKKEQHRSNLYDAEMPYMLRLTYDGIAIHAADVRAGRATHGCIGVPDGFARSLFAAVDPGDRVVIVT